MKSTDPTDASRPDARKWLVLTLVGVVGGLLSGAFGVGGGVLMVPLLISIARMDERLAAATSLLAIIPTSLAGSFTYFVNGQVDLLMGLLVAVGGVAGSYVGARLLPRIPLVWLRWMFIALLVLVAARLMLIAPERGAEVVISWPVGIGLVAVGLCVGVASGLFGIGGGVILVPILIALFGAGDLVAKGTSLLVMIPTAAMGTITSARAKLVDVKAGAVVGFAATVSSFGGVAFAFLVPAQLSGILFGFLLIISAVQLSVRAIRNRKG